MVDALSDKFEGFSISKSGMDKHLKESCSYTVKRITEIPAKRNSPDVIELRFKVVEAWIKDSNISFMQNCIFIDEAGFNLHTAQFVPLVSSMLGCVVEQSLIITDIE
ncbi:hypothetical protein RO3G_05042 [Rhizopus delemar RA 99-880]|uniref:Uncharacterized protein n=1 Tax=Rhizopus delemar (strain RA 99-880 / ATCC MYA-4621 / FGSC 9543 / NRRL 43880) TaxID=246409 RepID=I1BVV7_RHIO9|nr:hypothetical protein RO3G_05042 [Rhizopus delemar RA 99-880]|eukprot:EIE80337.1 hypothetical protein RO3G_05042 [Rhizopus delemar RA 99-880]